MFILLLFYRYLITRCFIFILQLFYNILIVTNFVAYPFIYRLQLCNSPSVFNQHLFICQMSFLFLLHQLQLLLQFPITLIKIIQQLLLGLQLIFQFTYLILQLRCISNYLLQFNNCLIVIRCTLLIVLPIFLQLTTNQNQILNLLHFSFHLISKPLILLPQPNIIPLQNIQQLFILNIHLHQPLFLIFTISPQQIYFSVKLINSVNIDDICLLEL